MSRHAAALAIASALLTASVPAFAQTAPASPAATTAASPGAVAPAGMMADSRLVMTDNGWRASKVIGSTVYNDNGETIGTVDDVILDNNSKATDAIISVGGFLGIGAKLVKVPYPSLRFEQNTTTVTTMTTITSTTVGGSGAGTPGNTTTSTAARPATPSAMTPAAAPTVASTGASTGAPLDSSNKSNSTIRLVLPGASKDQLTQMQTFSYP